jgi:hypothetical protein
MLAHAAPAPSAAPLLQADASHLASPERGAAGAAFLASVQCRSGGTVLAAGAGDALFGVFGRHAS